MKTHHVNYIYDGFNYIKPSGKDLTEQVSLLDDLAFGDQILMSDGQRLCFYLESLTDFDSNMAEIGYQSIISSSSPCLRVVDKVSNQTRHRAYAQRCVLLSDSTMHHQVLINGFGSPAWINICINTLIVK
ncbi:hypothetical protein LMH73_004715 [Vibrio splendidus]|nr:hypothetical protein [Vibrio splendidus]MCC4882531.1 hypothetical protein [Vibrio splendidus]